MQHIGPIFGVVGVAIAVVSGSRVAMAITTALLIVNILLTYSR